MQLLLEFFPLLAFVAAYVLGDPGEKIYVATATLMVAMVVSLLIIWFRTRKLPGMFATSTALVVVLGAATLILRSSRFIQWKPSVLLWLMAIAFLVSAFVGKQPLVQRLLQPILGEQQLARSEWLKLNMAWVVYGMVFGLINILVAYHASESAWVWTKSAGLMGSMFVFMMGQIFWLHKRGKLSL
jgi:intracellular septation protein